MKDWFTTTRLLVGGGIVAVGIVIGLAIGSIGDDESKATQVSDAIAEQRRDGSDDEDEATPSTEDLGFEAGIVALETDATLRTLLVVSNGAARLQDDALDALERGLTRLGNGDGDGASTMFDQRAGANVAALDRAVAEERELHRTAGEQADELRALIDEDEGLEDLEPIADAADEAVVAVQQLIALDEQVAALVGAMRTSLLDNRVPRYESQAFELAGVLAEAEAAGTAANEGLSALNEAFAEAAGTLEGFGVDRAALAAG